MTYTKILVFFTLLLLTKNLQAQTTTEPTVTKADTSKAVKTEEKKVNTLTISAEMRVRSEYRHGYRNLALHDTSAAFFINQRSRLNFDYKGKRFDFFTSLQDTRVWGQQDPREGHGTTATLTETPASTFPVYLFEIYAEPHFNDRWSARIGRQRIIYDNQRLFAENDWRLSGNAHDAVRLIYNDHLTVNTELILAFNQSGENNYTTNYVPNGFRNYKTLINHFLSWKVNKNFAITTLNTADGYQSSDPAKYKTTYMRFTNGGRLEYTSHNWYLTMSGYYQHGKNSAGRRLAAWYVQPEIKYSGIKNLAIRLGMEYMSGQDSASTKDNNFVPLYGVAHRFMGNLDLFSSFPIDVNNGGIVNPYLFFQYQNKKTTVRCENHLFYSQSAVALAGRPFTGKFLGFENDWRVNYKANSFTNLEFGFCWATVTNTMVVVKNPKVSTADITAYSSTPYWAYMSVTFSPTIGKFSF